jgi:signal-transduction protein with cAMP-binding, CBS, and nucleotidyltransferase domain
MLLKSTTAKSDSLTEEAKTGWLSQIKDYASYDVMTIQEDKKVLDHVQDMMSWNIDFIVVKDEGKVIRGVIGRDQLNDIVNEKKLEVRSGSEGDLKKMSFRDIVDATDMKEYYVIDQNKTKSEPTLWMQGLPAREVVLIKDEKVEAVVDRRWFKRWQGLVKIARYFNT